MTDTVDPRVDTAARLDGRYEARVLDPSPPARRDGPWFADDPVNADVAGDRPVVSPIATADVTWSGLARDDAALAEWCADRWLGAWRALAPIADVDALVRTRVAWHAVAEHVLAPARHRDNAKIGLRFTAGGFGTPWFRDANVVDVQLRVDGTDMLVVHPSGVDRTPIRDLFGVEKVRAYSAFLTPKRGEEVGAEELGYATTTVLSAEVLAAVDGRSAAVLGDWFGFGCSVLEELRAVAADALTTRCQLWPEHFDLSVELGDVDRGARATFGSSPGDDAHAEPYLYVAPWNDPGTDPYWNDTAFHGASLPYAALTGDAPAARATALDFFRTGQRRLSQA